MSWNTHHTAKSHNLWFVFCSFVLFMVIHVSFDTIQSWTTTTSMMVGKSLQQPQPSTTLNCVWLLCVYMSLCNARCIEWKPKMNSERFMQFIAIWKTKQRERIRSKLEDLDKKSNQSTFWLTTHYQSKASNIVAATSHNYWAIIITFVYLCLRLSQFRLRFSTNSD